MYRKLNNKKFIETAKEIHGDKYDYSLCNFTKMRNHIYVICKIHGCFKQTAFAHLSTEGCLKCSRITRSNTRINKYSKDDFIEKAQKIHNNKYDYSKVDFKAFSKKVIIGCPIHGDFQQKPNSHINRKHGCPTCGGYDKSLKYNDWYLKVLNKEVTFYIIKCWNENEEFFKFGITCNKVEERYNKNTKNCKMPYNYEIIKEIKSKDTFYIWDLEKRFKRIKKEEHYIPNIKFNGSKYECFKKRF